MIALRRVKLPSTYRKMAEITFAVRGIHWVTVAEFVSSTLGTVPVFFLRKHDGRGIEREISATVYWNLIRYYAK